MTNATETNNELLTITFFVVFVIFQRFETHHTGKLKTQNGSYKHCFEAVFDVSFNVTVHGLQVELALQESSDAEAISSGLALQASLSMPKYFRESKGMCVEMQVYARI